VVKKNHWVQQKSKGGFKLMTIVELHCCTLQEQQKRELCWPLFIY